MDGDPGACLDVAGGLAGFRRVHRDKEGVECGGSIDAFGGLRGTLSLAHSRLVVSYDKGGAVEKGVGEDGGAHAGGSVVLASGFGQVGNADASRLDGEVKEGAKVGGGGGRGGAT